MKAKTFPATIRQNGVSAVIGKTTELKGKKRLDYFLVEYQH
jgi:hypothetical protein